MVKLSLLSKIPETDLLMVLVIVYFMLPAHQLLINLN